VDPTSTHLYLYDCSLKSILSIFCFFVVRSRCLDTYKYCILRSSQLPQLYNKHPLLVQELLAEFSSSYCVIFQFQHKHFTQKQFGCCFKQREKQTLSCLRFLNSKKGKLQLPVLFLPTQQQPLYQDAIGHLLVSKQSLSFCVLHHSAKSGEHNL